MIELTGVGVVYGRKERRVEALGGVDLSVAAGEMVCLRGPSGAGKTTLLMVAGGMLAPSSGTVRIAGEEPYRLGLAARAAFRAHRVGFVFQTFHLVPYLDLTENLLLAGGGAGAARRAEAEQLLASVGLADRSRHHLPGQLSAGERQRAATARALLAEPDVILADEPTGNLDADSAGAVLDLLTAYRDRGGTVLLVTHGAAGDDRADRTLHLARGGGIS